MVAFFKYGSPGIEFVTLIFSLTRSHDVCYYDHKH